MIKLLIGGSPCTFWSIAQKNNRETTAEGIGWELFKNYLIAKEKFQPDFFLYENNKSAAQAIKDQIKTELKVTESSQLNLFQEDIGSRYIEINSALVSAQNRQRFYVHNCGNVEQPEDRGILLKDILEGGTFDAIGIGYRNRREEDGKLYRRFETHNEPKANAITTVQTDSMVAEPVCLRYVRTEEGKKLRKAYESHEIKHGFHEHCILQPRQDGKTNTLSTVLKDNQIAVPVCYSDESYLINPTMGKQVININPSGNGINGSVIHVEGKSRTLTTNKGEGQKIIYPCTFTETKQHNIYEVKDGKITIKDKKYPIKLKDGFYIIRKLTVKECCRLQTMPDDYCRAVSNSQAYKGLGNGWTAEVIIHILSGALKDVSKDEEIVVLSMYDGIGTGRYCLDKMGFTNVKYYAYEIDKYAMQISKSNWPDIIYMGDAFAVRDDNWKLEFKK